MPGDRSASLLGLAMKAGKVSSGEFAAENAIREGKAYLAIIATDASKNTAKRFRDKCSYYKVPIVFHFTKEELGRALGKEERAAAVITDKGLAEALEGKLLPDKE